MHKVLQLLTCLSADVLPSNQYAAALRQPLSFCVGNLTVNSNCQYAQSLFVAACVVNSVFGTGRKSKNSRSTVPELVMFI